MTTFIVTDCSIQMRQYNKNVLAFCFIILVCLIGVTDAWSSETQIINPPEGSTLNKRIIKFEWATGENIGSHLSFELLIGTAKGGSNLGRKYTHNNNKRSFVMEIPLDGSKIYVTLKTRDISGSISSEHYVYNTSGTPVNYDSVITSPAPGSTLISDKTRFKWTAGKKAGSFLSVDLLIGTTEGASDLSSSQIHYKNARSIVIDNIPLDGNEVYVTLETRYKGAISSSRHYVFDTLDMPRSAGILISPKTNQKLDSRHVYVSWTPGLNIQNYLIELLLSGTQEVLISKVVSSGESSALIQIPTNGEMMDIKFISRFNDGGPDYVDTLYSIKAASIAFEDNYERIVENSLRSPRGELYQINNMFEHDGKLYFTSAMDNVLSHEFSEKGLCYVSPPSYEVVCDVELSDLRVGDIKAIDDNLYLTGQVNNAFAVKRPGEQTIIYNDHNLVITDLLGNLLKLQKVQMHDITMHNEALWATAVYFSHIEDKSRTPWQEIILKSDDGGKSWLLMHKQTFSENASTLLGAGESQKLLFLKSNSTLFAVRFEVIDYDPIQRTGSYILLALKRDQNSWIESSDAELSNLKRFVSERQLRQHNKRGTAPTIDSISTFDSKNILKYENRLLIAPENVLSSANHNFFATDYAISDGYIYKMIGNKGTIERTQNLSDWELVSKVAGVPPNSRLIKLGILNGELYVSDEAGHIYHQNKVSLPMSHEFDVATVHHKAATLTEKYPRSYTAIRPLKANNGRLYMGYGDWIKNSGNSDICYYDPSQPTLDSSVVCEFTMESSGFEKIYAQNNKLYFLAADPSCDFTTKCGDAMVVLDPLTGFEDIPHSAFIAYTDTDTHINWLQNKCKNVGPSDVCSDDTPLCKNVGEGKFCKLTYYSPYHFWSFGTMRDGATQVMKVRNNHAIAYISTDYGLTWEFTAPNIDGGSLGTEIIKGLDGMLYADLWKDNYINSSAKFDGLAWGTGPNFNLAKIESNDELKLKEFLLSDIRFSRTNIPKPVFMIGSSYSYMFANTPISGHFNKKLILSIRNGYMKDNVNTAGSSINALDSESLLVALDPNESVTPESVIQDQVLGFTITDYYIYVLKTNGEILRSKNLIDWEKIATFYEGPSIVPTSFEVMNDVIYIGTKHGRVYKKDLLPVINCNLNPVASVSVRPDVQSHITH